MNIFARQFRVIDFFQLFGVEHILGTGFPFHKGKGEDNRTRQGC